MLWCSNCNKLVSPEKRFLSLYERQGEDLKIVDNVEYKVCPDCNNVVNEFLTVVGKQQ